MLVVGRLTYLHREVQKCVPHSRNLRFFASEWIPSFLMGCCCFFKLQGSRTVVDGDISLQVDELSNVPCEDFDVLKLLANIQVRLVDKTEELVDGDLRFA